MQKQPLVTVVIPTYRRAALVARAIESARRQTYANLEIIVVDDGSPDDTEEVVRREAAKDARVRYVRHSMNKGLPAGRNTGIRAARGEYIAFLDDDDEWRTDKIEQQVLAIGEHDAVLCIALSNGRPLRLLRATRVTQEDLRRGSFDPSSLLAKTTILRDIWFDESLRHGEDWDAFIRIGQKYSIVWLAEPLLFYNDGMHERMTNDAVVQSGPQLEARTAILQKHKEFFGERWYRYHHASILLAYIGRRRNGFANVLYAVRRCGLAPVIAVLWEKICRRTFGARPRSAGSAGVVKRSEPAL